MALPASRSSLQSGSSPTTAARLAADVARRLAQVAAQLGVAQRGAGRLGEGHAARSWAARISA